MHVRACREKLRQLRAGDRAAADQHDAAAGQVHEKREEVSHLRRAYRTSAAHTKKARKR